MIPIKQADHGDASLTMNHMGTEFNCEHSCVWRLFLFHFVTIALPETAGTPHTAPFWNRGPILDDFRLARFSAADFGLGFNPEYLPQLIYFFENDMGTIVGATAFLSVCARDGFLICKDMAPWSCRLRFTKSWRNAESGGDFFQSWRKRQNHFAGW